MRLCPFLMPNFALQSGTPINNRQDMNRKNDYQIPRVTVLGYPDEPLMALSAKPGSHVYDEGLDTEDGWTDYEPNYQP